MPEKRQLTDFEKEENNKFFDQVKSVLTEGGVWIWPDTGYVYKLKDGKLVSDSEEANEALREITE